MQPASILVLGGARSGKTRYALTRAEMSGLSPVYLATAAAWDSEMVERIARHKAERNEKWRTIEEERALPEAIAREAQPDRILLVDCLTLWLTNILLADADCEAETLRLGGALQSAKGPLIFVSNETGLGIVPDNALARRFRDLQGRLNQHMATLCDEVVFIAAGLPLRLKPGQ
jgi:adenosylcobinamide kinase / adenosylcobinamide-phosphate guanylyltransferase